MEIPRPKNWFTLVKITICLSKNSFQKRSNTKNVMAELSKKAHSAAETQIIVRAEGRRERGNKKGGWRMDLTVRAKFWHWRQLHTNYTATHTHTHTHTHTQSQGSSLNDPTTPFPSIPHKHGLVVPRINGIMTVFFNLFLIADIRISFDKGFYQILLCFLTILT